ncbi:MAG: laccase domain-containing protein, partial [Balneolaceae bacterium]
MKILEPYLYKPYKSVSAWFTEKNDVLVNTEGQIPGLNLGLNTGVPESELKYNRDLLAKSTGLDNSRFALAEQVHGSHVEFVSNPGIYPETDALITTSQ